LQVAVRVGTSIHQSSDGIAWRANFGRLRAYATMEGLGGRDLLDVPMKAYNYSGRWCNGDIGQLSEERCCTWQRGDRDNPI